MIVNVRRSTVGSNSRFLPRTASAATTAARTGSTSDSANVVRTYARPLRASSGSSKCLRRRANEALIAGWPSDNRAAARVTLVSSLRWVVLGGT